MLPFYEECCSTLGWAQDQALSTTMREANDAKIKQIEDTLKGVLPCQLLPSQIDTSSWLSSRRGRELGRG